MSDIVIANDAARHDGDSVVVKSYNNAAGGNAIVFQWSRQGVGFGELTFSEQDGGGLYVDTEAMGGAFCLDVLRQALQAEPLRQLLKRYLDNHCTNTDNGGMSVLCECNLCLDTRKALAL